MVVAVSRLADRWGARLNLILVGVAFGAACFGMAFSVGLVAFYLSFAGLRALGQGSLTINAVLLVNQWFVTRRGRAIALMGLGFPLSNAVLPPLSRFLIDAYGWREAYALLGVLVMLLIIPAAVFLVRNRPEDVGTVPGRRRPSPADRTDPHPQRGRGCGASRDAVAGLLDAGRAAGDAGAGGDGAGLPPDLDLRAARPQRDARGGGLRGLRGLIGRDLDGCGLRGGADGADQALRVLDVRAGRGLRVGAGGELGLDGGAVRGRHGRDRRVAADRAGRDLGALLRALRPRPGAGCGDDGGHHRRGGRSAAAGALPRPDGQLRRGRDGDGRAGRCWRSRPC